VRTPSDGRLRAGFSVLAGLALLLAGGANAGAQSEPAPEPSTDQAEPAPWVEHADAPVASVKSAKELEQELRKLRATYFGSVRAPSIRRLGIEKLKEYTQPAAFPALLEVFARERDDVRTAILDHLRGLRTDEADATLAWAAVHDAQKRFRRAASERLAQRVEETGTASDRVKYVIGEALKHRRDEPVVAAAELCGVLELYEAIPALINAQVSGRPRGGVDEPEGDLAYIVVGTQQTFVSDLQPVVGDSAVAFDPQLSVLTSGTVLRVQGAVVVTYRVDVHNALLDLSSKAWGGRSTKELGWDTAAWRRWYRDELMPYLAQQRAAGESVPAVPAAPAPSGPK